MEYDHLRWSELLQDYDVTPQRGPPQSDEETHRSRGLPGLRRKIVLRNN